MSQLLDAKKSPSATATISLKAAELYAADLMVSQSPEVRDVGRRIQGQISIAELSGQQRINMDEALVELMPDRTVDNQIDSIIDLVIDLRAHH